jgi:hypothetical protein
LANCCQICARIRSQKSPVSLAADTSRYRDYERSGHTPPRSTF